jgi:hypothetical protein
VLAARAAVAVSESAAIAASVVTTHITTSMRLLVVGREARDIVDRLSLGSHAEIPAVTSTVSRPAPGPCY